MKKGLLLGAILVLGATAFAQDNKVIVPVQSGNATAILPVEVTGRVMDPAALSLVVYIDSAASPSGLGFRFTPQDLMEEEEATLPGAFHAVMTEGKNLDGSLKEVPFTTVPVVSLLSNGTVSTTPTAHVSVGVAGTATDTVLTYSLNGGTSADMMKYTGEVSLKVEAGTVTGQYTDNSIDISVAVTGQAPTPAL